MTRDPAAAVADLAARYHLPARGCAQLAQLLSQLGDPEAPTTVREPERAVGVHLADSLVGLEVDRLAEARTIVDLGSGAGFPGLPLAVALPGARVTLLDSSRRRCAYLRRVCSAIGIGNAEPVAARAEEWDAQPQDAVVVRAVASLAVLLEYSAPLLSQGGVMVAWKGRRMRDEERSAAAAAHQVGLELEEVRAVSPFSGAGERYLHVYLKVRPTPERFPRRPGMARKRPLGGG